MLLLTVSAVSSQQHQQQQQQQRPLDDVLLLVLDKNKDTKVSKEELQTTLQMLDMLLQQSTAVTNDHDGEATQEGGGGMNDKLGMIGWITMASPTVFDVLDSNNDGSLSKNELNVVVQFENTLKKTGKMKGMVRDLFAHVDRNGDDQLSMDEILTRVVDSTTEFGSKLCDGLQGLFPTLRHDVIQEVLLPAIINVISTYNKDNAMSTLDTDGDGYIQRREVGMYYNKMGKQFMDATKMIKQMGPMLAMFGGGDMGGAGGGGGGFKIEL